MEREVVEKIKESLESVDSRSAQSKHILMGKLGEPVDIRRDNFNLLDVSGGSAGDTVFVDGGSALLIGSTQFALGFVRVCAVTYRNNKRVATELKEGYVFVQSRSDGAGIEYTAEVINPFPIDIVKFSSEDATIRKGVARADISSMIDVVRRFSELSIAVDMASGLSNGDMLVIDGSLQRSYSGESKYSEPLMSAVERGVRIVGLSKRTSTLTDSGDSACNTLRSIAPKGEWYYHPVVKPSLSIDPVFVKLHKDSKHIFRLDVMGGMQDIAPSLVSLCANASDPVFFGYPYGLIDVDRMARVSNEEKNYLKTKALTYLSGVGGMLFADPHGILDTIR